MELSDEIAIAAPRDAVYAALNDVDILRQCIPGCEELIRHSEIRLEARIRVKIGPVNARFGGDIELDPTHAPGRFSLSGKGSGGAAGFASGSADVTLEEKGEETILRYEARARVGGKLAQIGSRLVRGSSRKLAARFFEKFSEIAKGRAAT